MTSFLDDLDEDLFENFLDPDEFGESSESNGDEKGIRYIPSNGAPPRIIRALYDTPFASAGTEAEEDVNANRPHMTVRSCDLEGGRVLSGDRFVRCGIRMKPIIYDGSNGQGVCRFFLQNDKEI